MKAFIAIAILLVSGIQIKSIECAKKMDIPELKNMLKPMSKSCKSKSGVADDVLHGTVSGQWPKDRALMCYFRCMAITLKAMNKDGELTMPEINKTLNTLVIDELVPRIREVLEKCVSSVERPADSCEYAFELIFCAYKLEPDQYFIPS